jgi:hypothetical protein
VNALSLSNGCDVAKVDVDHAASDALADLCRRQRGVQATAVEHHIAEGFAAAMIVGRWRAVPVQASWSGARRPTIGPIGRYQSVSASSDRRDADGRGLPYASQSRIWGSLLHASRRKRPNLTKREW